MTFMCRKDIFVNKNYIDVTNEWLENATPNSHKVKNQLYFIDKNNIKYIVDGKNVVLEYSKKEKEIAEFLENIFGGEIYMLPRINIPEYIKTPDYLWNNEYWDLKEIKGSGIRNIDNKIKESKNQANNFIIDNSKHKLHNNEIKNQIEKIYKDPKRYFVNQIIIIDNKKLIAIYKRKLTAAQIRATTSFL